MNISRFITILAALGIFTSGCAFVPQKVKIQPVVTVTPGPVAPGSRVVIKVTDKRTSPIIGYRGLDSEMATIKSEQNLGELLQTEIVNIFRQRGFQIADDTDDSAPTLRVDLKLLEYKTTMDFWKGGVHTKATLDAHGRRSGTFYEMSYTSEKHLTAQEAPGAKTNAELINGAVSEALQKLADDPALVRFLTN